MFPIKSRKKDLNSKWRQGIIKIKDYNKDIININHEFAKFLFIIFF